MIKYLVSCRECGQFANFNAESYEHLMRLNLDIIHLKGCGNNIVDVKEIEGDTLLHSIAKDIEKVDHPKHYNIGKYEVIDVIEDWHLRFNLGNAIKYIARAPYKGNQLEDLKKAAWYLNREISNLERQTSGEKSKG